jgi:hypothetical protein
MQVSEKHGGEITEPRLDLPKALRHAATGIEQQLIRAGFDEGGRAKSREDRLRAAGAEERDGQLLRARTPAGAQDYCDENAKGLQAAWTLLILDHS